MATAKIVLVTGGSRGLGKDMALSIAQKGMDVLLTYVNNKEAATSTVQEIEKLGRKAAALPLNMNEPGSYDGFVQEVKKTLQSTFNVSSFDFLVNNAGIGGNIPFEKATEKDFDEFLNIHFKGVFFLTQKCLPLLNSGGGIINISTGTTRFAYPGYSIYASMKGGIEVFTRYMAKELGPKGLRANVVAPGPIVTDFNNGLIRNNPQLKEHLATLSPLGRVGEATDIGPVVAFLCTDEAAWINGQRIEVAGGINV
jgi:NAD(P)-dependent dehydrogenase (short-subunit alcohol dehydrogenase family)